MMKVFSRWLHFRWRQRLLLISVLAASILFNFFTPNTAAQSTTSGKDKRSAKVEARRQKALRIEMIDSYARWLSYEVGDIVTHDEVSVFKRLTTDDQREEFIQQFWERRNPELGSLENRFKQSFYL